MRRLASGCAAAALAATTLMAGSASVAGAAGDDQPLQRAAAAAAQVSFDGVLLVQWTDGSTQHRATLPVQGAHGSVVVRGDTAVMASAQQRLVERAGGVWDLLWPVDEVGSNRPPATRKYQLVDGAPTVVSGRPADVVEVWQGSTLLERLALDQATGLMLSREQFDNGREPYRTVAFVSVSIGGSTPAPDQPQTVVNVAPKSVAPARVPSGAIAPAGLGDGYQRIGVYERSGVVQALYSDGLYDLSVFQQDGRLDGHHLPAGSPVAIGTTTGRHYTWPGGHVVVWQRSGTVFTAVSDAPLNQVLGAVRDLPAPHAAVSFLHRLRQACRDLIEPLAS